MKLLPCPFCGASVIGPDHEWDCRVPYWEVRCEKCHTFGPTAATEREAAIRWNTRHEPEEEA